MRAFNRIKARGFTLVELMIVVAIIGVLAALAIYGVRKYLATAKTAEAKNTIGAINRAAVAAYERENMVQGIQTGASAGTSHSLCASVTNAVPTAPLPGKKYTATPGSTTDYKSGTATAGRLCLKFEMTEPQYYAYSYGVGATAPGLTMPDTADFTGKASGWVVAANGDLDGNTIRSRFATGGDIVAGGPITSTTIGITDELE